MNTVSELNNLVASLGDMHVEVVKLRNSVLNITEVLQNAIEKVGLCRVWRLVPAASANLRDNSKTLVCMRKRSIYLCIFQHHTIPLQAINDAKRNGQPSTWEKIYGTVLGFVKISSSIASVSYNEVSAGGRALCMKATGACRAQSHKATSTCVCHTPHTNSCMHFNLRQIDSVGGAINAIGGMLIALDWTSCCMPHVP